MHESAMKKLTTIMSVALTLCCASISSWAAQAIDVQRSFIRDTRILLVQKRFDELDQLGERLLRDKSRFVGGDWKLYRYYGALGRPAAGWGDLSDRATVSLGASARSDEMWQTHIALLRQWQAARPKSLFARIALGDVLVSYAWKARGAGFAPTVTDAGAERFTQRLNDAKSVLTDVTVPLRQDPHWYCVMIDLARGLGWSTSEVVDLAARGSEAEPQYQYMYSAVTRYLTPRWYGEPGDWERFADWIAQRIGGREGSAIYGHIALQMSTLYGARNFFPQNRVRWDRLKRAFADQEALYGVDRHTLNAFTLLSLFASDNATSRALFTRIGEDWDPDVWQQRSYFDNDRARVFTR